MGKPEFTPGPWKARMNCDVMAGERMVADCMSGWLEENKANARLIAAAPDMYEAAEAALECLESNGFGKAYVEDLLRTALRKARGES